MSTVILLAPGPSMSQALANRVREIPDVSVGVVTSAWPLAPWADFLAAQDVAWWLKNPEVHAEFSGAKYSANRIRQDVVRVQSSGISSATNSGVLALEVARLRGAERVIMLGFDQHGTHYFGPYKNGLTNTPQHRRQSHKHQFRTWWHMHKGSLEVLNCTEGSSLTVFPISTLEEAVGCPVP